MNTICRKKLSGISAYDLHKELNLNSPPFNPFTIAERLGIVVNQDLNMENMQLSGSITNKNGEVTIWVNPLDPDVRQRFTLAHELGHYVHDILVDGKIEVKDTPDTLYRDGKSHHCEVRANNFAGMLLMPKEPLLDRAIELIESSDDKKISTTSLVSSLAETFQVSKPAMLVRLKKLGMVNQKTQI